MADVRQALRQRPLKVAVVQDGAPQPWTLLTNALQRNRLMIDDWTEVLDWYHLDERLSKCLDLCVPARSRSSQRKRWHSQLLDGNGGIRQVIRSLRHHHRKLTGADAQALQVHINYFLRNKRRTYYASCRRACTPIGSGITEGACKSVIGARAKRSGQRWSQRGLTAALHFRSVHQSERFDSFWSFFTHYYRARAIIPTIGA